MRGRQIDEDELGDYDVSDEDSINSEEELVDDDVQWKKMDRRWPRNMKFM